MSRNKTLERLPLGRHSKWLPPASLAVILWLVVGHSTNYRASALDNGLALRPPMGWLAWERFTCQVDCQREPDNCVSESLYLAMAERLIQDGYLDAGYHYVNIDDCWSELARDPTSERLVANSSRFPGGLAQLAHQMHRRNLKLGLYGDCGHSTCAGYPGQLRAPDPDAKRHNVSRQDNYFELDAETFADWRIDSFKFDGCHLEPQRAELICPMMAKALNRATAADQPSSAAGAKLPVLLICEWPFYMMYAHLRPNFTLAAESCNVWRYYDDIEDSWLSILNTLDYTVKHQSTIVKYHGPGHWFDPDQLVIGNFGLSLEQAKAQMALWSIWSAPLYMSNDLRNIRPEFGEILKNKHLIGVDQDPLGVFGLMVASSSNNSMGGNDNYSASSQQAFVKPVLPARNLCPSFAVLYLNRNHLGDRQKVSFKLADLLPAAPIFEASDHLYKIQSKGLELDSVIGAKLCARRLNRAAGSPQDAEHYHEPIWAAYDLFDGGRKLGEYKMDSYLDLVVNPSGVRAVKLEEIS